MPKKVKMTIMPDRLGLSQKEVMYLFVFKELKRVSQHPAAIFKTMQEQITEDFLKSRAQLYTAVEEMVQQGWLSFQTVGRKKIYSITAEGEKKIEWYRKTYHSSFLGVKALADHFIFLITGSGKRNTPMPDPDSKHHKLFNRLINVRELAIYLYLKSLSLHGERTAKEILQHNERVYGWTFSVGYSYQLAREIEQTGWIVGRWENDLRTRYFYRLTDDGHAILPKAEESALYYIRNVQRFIKIIVELLGQEEKQ